MRKIAISDETSARGVSKETKALFKMSLYGQFAVSKATPTVAVVRLVIHGLVSSSFTLRK